MPLQNSDNTKSLRSHGSLPLQVTWRTPCFASSSRGVSSNNGRNRCGYAGQRFSQRLAKHTVTGASGAPLFLRQTLKAQLIIIAALEVLPLLLLSLQRLSGRRVPSDVAQVLASKAFIYTSFSISNMLSYYTNDMAHTFIIQTPCYVGSQPPNCIACMFEQFCVARFYALATARLLMLANGLVPGLHSGCGGSQSQWSVTRILCVTWIPTFFYFFTPSLVEPKLRSHSSPLL